MPPDRHASGDPSSTVGAEETDDAEDVGRTERRTAVALVSAAFVFAVLFHSLFFHVSDFMRGDITYHRGVALTMTSGHFQGEGPFRGLLSYYGGLYPLLIGWASRLTGQSFDHVLSVASWLTTPLLPLALLALGRSVFSRRWSLETGFLVLLGTAGGSWGYQAESSWVYSVLPSGTGEWPVYPRDAAFLLLTVALAVLVRRPSIGHLVAAGVLAGLAICFHAQIGAYAVLVLVAFGLWRDLRRGPARSALGRGLLLGLVAAATSAWWWLPRVLTALDSGPLLLGGYPGRAGHGLTLLGLLTALGLVGVLAVPGVVLSFRRRDAVGFAAVWLVVCAPIVVVANITVEHGLLTGRRSLFLAGLPLVVCAAVGAAAVVRRFRPPWASLALGAAVLGLAVAEVLPTLGVVSTAWSYPSSVGALDQRRALAPAELAVRREVLAHHGLVAVAPDNDGLLLWSRTGAQVVSLHLSGITKLGFDPYVATGMGYLRRVHVLDDAFHHGLPGVCRLAEQEHARLLVLRRREGQLGTFDVRPAARFRVAPQKVSASTINRLVGPRIRYVDTGDNDFLALKAGATVGLRWHSPRTRLVEVDLAAPSWRRDSIELHLGSGSTMVRASSANERQLVFRTPGGVPAGSVLVATQTTSVLRVIGFEPWRRPLGGAPDSLTPLATRSVCSG